jgi:hypothetical protein
MQDNVMQPAMQPFIKLVQANMELLTKLSTSPETMSQLANALNPFQPGQGSATNLVQSNAFAQLMQGMLKNYTEFMMELGQSGMAVLAQSQAAMTRQAQEFSENVIDASQARGPRTRQAA